MARRSQTTSYTRLQAPETKKKAKNQRGFKASLLRGEPAGSSGTGGANHRCRPKSPSGPGGRPRLHRAIPAPRAGSPALARRAVRARSAVDLAEREAGSPPPLEEVRAAEGV